MSQTPAEQEQARVEKQRRIDAGEEQPGGEVAEVGRLDEDEADEPIYPDQAVAGYPDSESGRPDEGPAGPGAQPAKES